MKNLKRALSFAVAAVMLVGMMAVGTSAFTDDAAINGDNATAVNVMNQLGIINGKPDGSFDPEANVSRAEMAKMICVALNGGKDPKLEATSTYTDTVGNWAAGYIEYCSNLGIIAGYNGLFRPADSVTGTEAAKMLLVAIGYSAADEGFVNNPDWSMNINILANKTGLYEDVSSLPAAVLNRQNAAQMIYNALYANQIVYDYQLTSNNGNLESVAVAYATKAPLIVEKFDLVKACADGILTDVVYNSKDENYSVYVNGNYIGRVANDYSALFMQKVTVLKNDTTNKLFGLYAVDSEVLVSTTYANVTALTGKIEIDEVEYEFDATAPVYAFLNDTTSAQPEWAATLIDNDDDGKANVVVVYPTTVAKVTFVGSKNALVGTYNFVYEDEDAKLYDGIAKNDWAVIVDGAYTVDADAVVTEAEIVTAKVEATKATNQYKVNSECLTQGTGYADGALTIGTEYDITVVNGYYYAASAVEEEFTASNMLYVMAYDVVTSDTGLNAGTQKAKVMFADGTTAVVTIDKIGGETISNTNNYTLEDDAAGNTYGLYTFKTDKDGNYELTRVDGTDYDATFAGTVNFVDGKADNNYRFNDDAVIWFVDGDGEVSVISGANVNKWDDEPSIGAKLLGEKKSGFGYVQVGLMTAATVPGAAKDECYGMIVAAPYVVNVDDTDYVQLTIWNGTKNIDVVYEGSDDTVVAKGDMISFKLADGEISNVAPVGTKGAVTAYDGTYIQVDCLTGEYKITEDTVVIYVDSDKVVGVEGGEIQLAHKDTDGTTLVDNVYVAGVDAKNEVAVLFVDVTNDWAE